MLWDNLFGDWPRWSGTLSKRFPYHTFPSHPPLPHQRDEFVSNLANTHHLTREEVIDTLETSLLPQLLNARKAEKSFAFARDKVWPL